MREIALNTVYNLFTKRENEGLFINNHYSQMHWSKKTAIELLMVVLLGLVMAFLGPFGTYAMPSGLRIAYWVIFGVIGYLLYRPMALMTLKLRDVIPIPIWAAELLGCMMAAVPFTFLVAFMVAGLQWDWALIMRHYGLLYVQCTVLGFGIYLLMRVTFDRFHDDDEANNNAGIGEIKPVRSKLHDHLLPNFPNQIDALQSEDHYVHVYARDNQGERKEMILMRLSDAIREVSELDGFQTHRSWWVANHAVKEAKRDGRNYRFILHSGLEVPISKSHIEMLKERGLL